MCQGSFSVLDTLDVSKESTRKKPGKLVDIYEESNYQCSGPRDCYRDIDCSRLVTTNPAYLTEVSTFARSTLVGNTV